MRAYYYDNEPTDQRLPHECNPPEPVGLADLEKLGVLHWCIPVDKDYQRKVDEVARERDFKDQEVFTYTRAGLGDEYDAMQKLFFTEHLHDDEEIRYFISGSGYFDVRGPKERWIRMACVPGDLLVLPAGMFHRSSLDTNDDMKSIRLFKDRTKMNALYREQHPEEAKQNIHRIQYLKSIGAAA